MRAYTQTLKGITRLFNLRVCVNTHYVRQQRYFMYALLTAALAYRSAQRQCLFKQDVPLVVIQSREYLMILSMM